MDEELEAAKERSWREVAAFDAAYERGELDDDGWHAATARLVVAAYLAARTAEAGSGSSRDEAGWEYARSLIADTVEPGQTFSTSAAPTAFSWRAWLDGAASSPYGLEISPELADLARRRLPEWADRIWVGNALAWEPPHRFDVVRTGIDYVPAPRLRRLVEHLLSYSRRLVIGVFNEARDTRSLEDEVTGWGFAIASRSERLHPHPSLAYRAFWIDS